MLPLLALADDLQADARLKVALTIEARYLPLPEFARRLSAASKETITVGSSLSGRKLVLYVQERPLAETMMRVADALGAAWTAQKGGWRLMPNSSIDKAERAAPAAFEATRQKALVRWLVQKASRPANSKDNVGQSTVALLRDLGTGTAATMLLAGKTLVGTGDGRAGTHQIPMENIFAGYRVRQPDGSFLTPSNAMIILRLEPESGRILSLLRSLGGEGRTGTIGWFDPMGESKPDPDELDRLDDAWARESEAGMLDTKLKSIPSEPDPYGAGLASLADVLARLHAQTGFSVAAESFRAPVAPWGDHGTTVADTLRSVVEGPMVKFGGVPRFVWKGSGDWLLVRTPAAWSLRRGEIPENLLVPLEAKKLPSIEEYASLAGSLSEAQQVQLERFRPLATFPTVTLRLGYWGLAVYDALPAALRNQAKTGIAFDDLPSLAQHRWRRAIVEQVARKVPPESWVDAVLTDHVPRGAGFQAVADENFVQGFELGPLSTDSESSVNYRSITFRFTSDKDTVAVHAPLVPAPH